uniref:Uncharacterized protein n=1 Tax=Aceria tosichella TaxID=561515 RepID=A0A6G1S8H5_9ACAR
MSPSFNQYVKTLVLVVVLGYLLALDSSEARGLDEQQQQDEFSNYNQGNNIQQAQQQQLLAAAAASQRPTLTSGDAQNLDRLDSDDDDDDDDGIQQVQADQQNNYYDNQQPQQMNSPAQVVAGSDLYQTDQSYQAPYQPAPSQDLKPAASKHYGHHKHGAKGWLDMGAWTGKKGAFGWYDKHPVGGKGRK